MSTASTGQPSFGRRPQQRAREERDLMDGLLPPTPFDILDRRTLNFGIEESLSPSRQRVPLPPFDAELASHVAINNVRYLGSYNWETTKKSKSPTVVVPGEPRVTLGSHRVYSPYLGQVYLGSGRT